MKKMLFVSLLFLSGCVSAPQRDFLIVKHEGNTHRLYEEKGVVKFEGDPKVLMVGLSGLVEDARKAYEPNFKALNHAVSEKEKALLAEMAVVKQAEIDFESKTRSFVDERFYEISQWLQKLEREKANKLEVANEEAA